MKYKMNLEMFSDDGAVLNAREVKSDAERIGATSEAAVDMLKVAYIKMLGDTLAEMQATNTGESAELARVSAERSADALKGIEANLDKISTILERIANALDNGRS